MASNRILIFSTAYLPLIGGAEIAVKEITDRIPDHSFVMITARLDPKLKEVEQVGKIEVHRIGKGNAWDKLRLISKGPRLAATLGTFDTVWAIMASYAGFAALRYKKKNPSIPFLLTLQEGDSKWHIYKHVWWCWWYFKQIFQKANQIQAISNYLARWAKSLGARCPVEVIPNGVAIKNFLRTNDRAPAMSDQRLVITASRLVKKNGVGDLISAMQFLPDNVQLRIAGSGELELGLKQLTRQLKVEDRVQFLGSVSHQDLPQQLWECDVFCRPSLSEGLGNAFLEAMAAGLPVVATNVGGIPDFLKDGETGLFCKVGDPEDIAKQIKRILDDEQLASRLRSNDKKLVEEKYSWDTVAIQMRSVFANLRNPQ